MDGGGVRVGMLRSLAELAGLVPDARTVAIDIPIGLTENGIRRCDGLARALLGPRRSSVFSAPPRDVLAATDHPSASALCRQLTGKGLSRQSFFLFERIRETEAWLQSTTGIEVREAHPELAWTTLPPGGPCRESKHRPAGLRERAERLAALPWMPAGDILEWTRPAGVKPDDLLDALACLHVAVRIGRGEAVRLPDPPEIGADGRPCSISF
ncbi:MAG: DUF429 domain-containing protein [Fimbriimonadaceae bacterium]|nr:DUF429 domain-containing protein [Fimbriimonadaceae bacterium]